MRSYAFARQPRWIVGHVLVLVAVVAMVNLGLWQLRRLDERRDANDRVAAGTAAAPVDVTELAGEPIEDVEFRRVEATGTFDAAHEVLVGYRTSQGLPGYHVVTPLYIGTGEAVLVNRGFVPLRMAEQWPDPGAVPPAGTVTVFGVARRTADARSDRVTADDGETPKLNNVDVEAIDTFVPGRLLPLSVELQEPSPPGFPVPLPDLDLTEGPHLNYAVQWFSFASIAAVGWLVILRRRAHRPGGTTPVNAP